MMTSLTPEEFIIALSPGLFGQFFDGAMKFGQMGGNVLGAGGNMVGNIGGEAFN